MQGSLSEFRLSDILQLVAVQQKTGLLRLVRGQQVVTLYFDRGVLVSTRDRRHVGTDPLFGYLERVGWLQPDMAAFLRSRLDGTKEDVAQLLLDERFLSIEELNTTLEDLAQEVVHQTFTWRDGTYQFIGGDAVLAGLDHRLSLKIDTVLMEAARRADEWPRIQERLPGPDVIVDAVQPPTPDLGDRAFQVIAKISGHTRLGEIVQSSRIPEYEVYEIVAQAIDSGIVQIVEAPEPAPARVVREQDERPTRPRRRVERPGSELLSLPRPLGWGLSLLLAVLAAVGACFVAPHLRSDATRIELQRLAAAEAWEQVRLGIEIHRAAHGRYPRQLSDLVQDEIVSPALLARVGGFHYSVSADGKSFEFTATPAAPQPARAPAQR